MGKNANAPLVLLSLAALTAAVALFAFYLFTRPPGDGSVEAGFARDMIVHHAQAVEMADIVRDKTESDEIRTLAKDIATTQQGQKGQMQGWLDVWGLSPTGTEPAMAWMGHPTEGRMHGMASTEDLERLREAPPEEADRLFLQLMIPHHEAAVPMSEAAIRRSNNPEVERLSEAIIASQTSEIKVMEAMLRERGEEPPAEDSHSHSMEGM